MNKIISLSAIVLLCSSSTAFADFINANSVSTFCKPGFYAGVETGLSNTHYTSAELLSESQTAFAGKLSEIQGQFVDTVKGNFANGNVNSSGMSGRFFAGYQFTPYFALETGYTQFNKTDFSGAGYISDFDDDGLLRQAISQVYEGELTEHALDLMAKFTLPLQYGFGIFVKGGFAYIAADRHINLREDDYSGYSQTHTYIQNVLYTASYQAVRPTYSVGVNYTIPKTPLDLSVSYTEIVGGGGISKTSLAALGISIKFG
jgi:hypothetical protein